MRTRSLLLLAGAILIAGWRGEIESRHLPSPRLRRAGATGVPLPRVLLLLRSPFGLPPQPQRERYSWRRFHLIPGWKLSSAWGQDKETDR